METSLEGCSFFRNILLLGNVCPVFVDKGNLHTNRSPAWNPEQNEVVAAPRAGEVVPLKRES